MNTVRPRVRKIYEERLQSYTEATKSQVLRHAEKEAEVQAYVNKNLDPIGRTNITKGDLRRKRKVGGRPIEVAPEIVEQIVNEVRPDQPIQLRRGPAQAKNRMHVCTVNNAFEKDSL